MSRPQSTASSRHASPTRSDRGQSPTRWPRGSISQQTPNIAGIVLSDPAPQLTKRPGFGTVGKQVKARVNFFKLNIAGTKSIISYAAEHKETANGREVRRTTVQRTDSLLLNDPRFKYAASNYGARFFTQEGAVLVRPGQNSYEHVVDFFNVEESGPRQGERKLRISVILKQDGAYPITPFQAYINDPSNSTFPRVDEYTAVFNTLIDRLVSENPNVATYARRTKYFDTRGSNGRVTLGNGLEAYRGYFKSVRDCIDGLFININTSACAMFKQGRLDTVLKDLGVSGRFPGPVIKGVRVKMNYSGQQRNRTVIGLAPPNNTSRLSTADNVTIQCPQHGEETVEQHFRRAWPAVQRPNTGALVIDFGNKVYIPSDLCDVLPGSVYRGALSSSQTTKMIDFACRKPKINRDLILREGVPFLRFGVAGGLSDRFGITLANPQPQMMQVVARLLPAPTILFAGNKPETYSSGAWNLKGRKFIKAATDSLVRVSYLDLCRYKDKPCQNFRDLLKGFSDGMRQYLGSNSKVQTITDFDHSREIPRDKSANNFASDLKDDFQVLLKKSICLVLVILPDKDVNTYYAVKKAGDLLTGIHTVCTVRDERGNVKHDIGFIANLMLKLNQKLGGVNFALKPLPGYSNLLGGNTMIIGADVTHPGPSAMEGAPSIAAVVASIDQSFFHYPGSVRLQETKDENKKAIEMIRYFRDMVVERQTLYKSKNGRLPDRIIFVRDGVSDSQFCSVINEELPQLKTACKQVYESTSLPNLLVITTQKRHHTRFYQEDGTSGGDFFDRNGNPLPGFTIDKQIVSKHHFDWYTTSHACIQGTSRPCKYVVLYDTIGVSADQIQMMMYHMCFTFGRATRSIGIHPAARYADLLCDRARVYFRDVYNPLPMPQGQEKPVYSIHDGHWPGRIMSKVKDTMFYV